MYRVIELERSIIPACDVRDIDSFRAIAEAAKDCPGVGALKIGFFQVYRYGLPYITKLMKDIGCDKPIIVDMQKAGTDIPDFGVEFAEIMRESGVPAAILFPLSGCETQREWTKALQDVGVIPIIGGHMTHKGYLVSDGGYIADDAPERIYRLAIEQGVTNFVLPGNQVEVVAKYTKLFTEELGAGNFDEYSPGFIKQGGALSEVAQVAGDRFHGIIGRAIIGAADKAAAMAELTSQLAVR